MDETCQLGQREFERAGYGGGRLPAGVVLTGGTAHLPGTVELAREAFALPVRAGTPEQGISGLVDSVQAPRYAVPVGLVLYAARRLAHGGVPSGALVKNGDRKSTRLNSSHSQISYAVFCLKKKKTFAKRSSSTSDRSFTRTPFH